MPSTLSWLDYSEHDRRQVLDIVDLFRERDTRDELGVGVIRDTFSDILFPGTSTIQTRAKYFLFIPWIYRDLEGKRVSLPEFESRARREETKLIDALLQSGERDGVIGQFARGALQRLPSVIYWSGLQRWGILLPPVSREYYIRTIDTTYHSATRNEYGDDGSAPIETRTQTWHPELVHAPDGFPQDVTFNLTTAEAAYLRDRIITRVPRTMLAHLIQSGRRLDDVEVPWQLTESHDLTPRIQWQLLHAENFSLVMWGAALLYNLMLALALQNDDRIHEYHGLLDEWSVELHIHGDRLRQWNCAEFWELLEEAGARVPLLTRRFVDTWLNMAIESTTSRETVALLCQSEEARCLIHQRERSLKRGKARLDNQRALELWNGAAGAIRLTYRWPQARRIITDILDGLEAADHA